MSSRPASLPATTGEVFGLIRSGQANTRSEIGRITGLSRTAVAARIASLLSSGLVVEGDEAPSSGGRPPSRLRFNRDAGVVLACAIGRSRTQLAVCDLGGEVLASADLEQATGIGPDELMPKVVDRLTALLEDVARPAEAVKAAGVSIPGTVDSERGASLDSPIMWGWDGIELAPYFHKRFVVPVVVDNDANVMAMSERQGHLETFRNVLLVKASTGLGAGVVANGVLLRGALGAAGEIGHSKSLAAKGRTCRCGDTGCLEAVAGGWALVQSMKERGREVTHIRDLVAMAIDGDAEARLEIRDSGRRLGEVLAVAANLLNPDAIVLGGDMAQAYDAFAAGVRETIYGNATALATRELAIVPATHGDRSGVHGCAAVALDRVLSVEAVDRALSG